MDADQSRKANMEECTAVRDLADIAKALCLVVICLPLLCIAAVMD